MVIHELRVENFKRFETLTLKLHSQFNLLVGNNGSGKTSALDALAVAMGGWLLGIPEAESRHIRPDEIREISQVFDFGEVRFEKPGPARIIATGTVAGTEVRWERQLKAGGRTTRREAAAITELAEETVKRVLGGASAVLPLLSYYGTGRLWLEPRENSQVKDPKQLQSEARTSRMDGYKNSADPRISVRDLVRWFAQRSWSAYRTRKKSPAALDLVKSALLGCLEGASDLYFDPDRGEMMVSFEDQGLQPFANLSDGQRSMFALVGDLAQKAIKLNPQFGKDALLKTPGIVLIDELDLHLHPQWQRRVVDDLTRTFPLVQFVCTTHSPQIIGQVRPEQLRVLDGNTVLGVEKSFGLDSNTILRDIMESRDRDESVQGALGRIESLVISKEWAAASEEIAKLEQAIGRTVELQRFLATVERFRRLSA